ncbi:pesticin C-terminus-like muramidase [Vibrio lentus]|uniref:pesticin C-terminus-like muramidase n=3 Tax=Vibrio lentus TaxID=136468 RepID=UPI0039A40794
MNVGDEITIEVDDMTTFEPEYHTCQLDSKTNQRETWSSIAALYNISAKSLLGMNPDYDADPSALSLGDKLQVTLSKESSGQSSVRSALPAEDVTTSKTAFAHSNVQCEVSSKTHCNVNPIVGDSGADKNTTVVKVKQLILRSEPLSTSDTLELLASGGGEALSKGSKGVEVKAIQKSLIDLGFDLGQAGADGDFGQATESAFKQFQKVYEPTHTTHETYQIGQIDGVVDKNTILALDESVHENWQYIDDEMDEKWLTVPKGQLTFGNEGNDSADSIYFTRVPHVPNAKGVVIGESGITLGRGLDLGSRNQGDVEQIFSNVSINCKPISHSLLEWLKKGAGLRGQKAYDHYKTLDSQVPELEQELTRKQQHFLFLEIYPFYEKETERLLTKSDVRSFYDKESVITWRELPRNIREVLVDITYRGDNRSSSRKRIVPSLVADVNDKLSGSVSNFYLLMKDAKFWVDDFKVDNNRYEARYKALLT